MESSVASMDETARPQARERQGGWISFPFIIGTVAGLNLACGGWTSNLIVYLIEEFNIKSISAAKIYNIVNGSMNVFPIIGAIVADSFLGCFSVICFSSLISMLGILFLVLTAAINHLRPPKCDEIESSTCEYPSELQFAVLYLGLALSTIGTAGARFTIAPLGANQFDSPRHQGIFFNWYIFTMHTAVIVSSSVVVYIEDNISWTLGFGLCLAAGVLGLAVFLSGSCFYRFVKPKGSPFTGLACVVVGAIRKRKMVLSEKSEDYYHDLRECATKWPPKNPSHFFRFLNRAALRTEGDVMPEGSSSHPQKLCTVQQVEDLKCLIKIVPLWSTGLFLRIPLIIQISFTVIQALSMDRRLGSGFKIPAGSMTVVILVSSIISITFIDRILLPLWERFTHKPLTLLQRIGIGHGFIIISLAVSAIVESKRLNKGKSGNLQENGIVPLSALWLVPQLAVTGLSEAFHFPGQITLYYQEFPKSLKSTSTAAVATFMGIAYYSSNALIDIVRKVTRWLPEDINNGRLDNVYWLCCILGGLNFAYYLACVSLYKNQNCEKPEDCPNKN